MRRYENHSTIMTSNSPLEEWGKLLGDVPTAGAILDDFLHHAQVIAITGRSYRVKDLPTANQESRKTRKAAGAPVAKGEASPLRVATDFARSPRQPNVAAAVRAKKQETI